MNVHPFEHVERRYLTNFASVFFSPKSNHEPTMPYSPTGGVPFAPTAPSYEFAPSSPILLKSAPIPRASVPVLATRAPFRLIPDMGMDPSFAPNFVTNVPKLATAVPVPRTTTPFRPTTGSILPTTAPFPLIVDTLPTANTGLSNKHGSSQSFGRPRPETTQPAAKQPDLAASPPVTATSPVSASSAPVFSPAVAPGSAPFVAPDFVGGPITSPPASKSERPLMAPVIEAPEAPSLLYPVEPLGRYTNIQPFDSSTVLASKNVPIRETPVAPIANSPSAPVETLQPFTSTSIVESTVEILKPVSNATFRDSGPSVTATAATHEPPSAASVRTVPLETGRPLTSSPASSAPTAFAPTTVAPTSLHSLPHSQNLSAPITILPTEKGNATADGEQLYRREYTSRTITLVLEGGIDLEKEQAKLFQLMQQQMQCYLLDVFGSVMEDFELSITFRYTGSDTDGRRLEGEEVYADVAVIFSLVGTDPILVRSKSQEDIDKIFSGFFERDSLQALLESMKKSRVQVTALSTAFLDGGVSTTKPGTKLVFVGVMTGGLAVVGIAAAFLYKERRCSDDLDEEDVDTLAAVRSKSDPFASHCVPSTMMIVPFGNSRKYHDALLDAPNIDAPSILNKEMGFKVIDGPDLVASTPGLGSWNGMWDNDCHSTAESTAYSRSDFLDDRPRPEYDSRQPGQRFRPWDSDLTNQRKPIKQSRLMRPFQPSVTHHRNDNESIASESSMQPLVSRSRKTKKPKPKPESQAPTGGQDVEGDE